MFARPQDLLTLSGKGGELFEQLLYDLVVEEARKHGIPPSEINWDHRTSVRDGGRDIVLRRGHGTQDRHFLPEKPSVWSAKTGNVCVNASKFREELCSPKHPKIRDHLRAGGIYVWCALHPAKVDDRQMLEGEAKDLAFELGFSARLIEFRWLDALTTVLNDHPNLIAKHLPGVAEQTRDVLTLASWAREDIIGFSVPWVEFADRSQLRDGVRQHLLGQGEPNVLHLAGLSGTGKSRTALEACRAEPLLAGILYVRTFESFTKSNLLQHLEAPDRQVQLIIDEVPLTKLQGFIDQVSEYANRLRFVTIGPARRGERQRSDLLVLSEPETETGVLNVVRGVGEGLPEEVLRAIAGASSHDLRLAIRLVFDYKQNPEFWGRLILGSDDILERVFMRFSSDIGDIHTFRDRYSILTSCIDVGRSDAHRKELKYLAQHFAVAAPDLDQAIDVADRCGLGICTPSFFEASPRALAVRLFQDRIWGHLRPSLQAFWRGIPSDRMRRRFIERCQECTGSVREEVEAYLAGFFWNELGQNGVAQLANRERSRVFQAWGELDPQRCLAWLRAAVQDSSPEELGRLDGETDGTGGWRGRRHIVWLCEHLACFAEYFWDCEAILFRLAQVETEQSIGNNSTNIWQSMFWPVLSGTEVPFPERFELLLRRLSEATVETVPLVISACLGATQSYFGGRLAPPRVVGGRVVPEQWKPASRAALRNMTLDAGRRFLAAVRQLSPPIRKRALTAVMHDLGRLAYYLGLVEELKNVFAADEEDEQIRRMIRFELAKVIEFRERVNKADPKGSRILDALRQWHRSLATPDLADRVKELTAQDYWFNMHGVGH